MPEAIQPRSPSPANPVSESSIQNVNGSPPRAWSRMALALGAALFAAVKSNPGASALIALGVLTAKHAVVHSPAPASTPFSPIPTPIPAKSPYPKDFAEFLHNGTFGAPFKDGVKLDGVVVSRGDKLSNTIADPFNKGGGLILCDRAKKIFDQYKSKPKYSSPEGQFRLALKAAQRIRREFMSLPVLGHGQNFIAAVHTHNSKALPGGSPLLSLTLNNFTAGYFGLGGMDNDHNSKPVNEDGKVFLGRVNNASTIYPIVARKIKGVELNNNPDPTTDRGMNLGYGINIPFSEMLIVGGYYFHDTLSVQDAFRQPLDTLRQIPDLYGSSVSFQMLEPIEGEPLFLPFHSHINRIAESLRNG